METIKERIKLKTFLQKEKFHNMIYISSSKNDIKLHHAADVSKTYGCGKGLK